MANATTVQLSRGTKERLESLKNYKRETFDEVISKLLALIPEGDEEGKYSPEFRAGLLEALYESKTGKAVSLAQMKKITQEFELEMVAKKLKKEEAEAKRKGIKFLTEKEALAEY